MPSLLKRCKICVRLTLCIVWSSPFPTWSIMLCIFTVDEAASLAHAAIMDNMGQCCCAGSRTYVQDTIYDEFVQKSKELAEKRRIGDPFENQTQHGPQV